MQTSKRQMQKIERIEARVTSQQKTLIQQAAEMQGRTLTDFVVHALQDAAERVIKDSQVMDITRRDQEVLVAALLNPPQANARLKAAAKLYKQWKADKCVPTIHPVTP
jgi:uncharacterized protein (DUF1778 family)